ncbi:hypothetical protein [Pseudoruegeria sp. SHC-113]|uniref:hypothetical protein n=1 Tax=Pseudoruegeria sp. SHC-113 TaxID=2855439 RepID=UPI0021BA447A|nr:hypothetical protein [Pseudoruegeria sp. SHC-113]MCT8159932.1 hypothetical protein [Pseudoruegeria sp. SHC-113]
MAFMVWIGAAFSVLGLVGLIYCIYVAAKAKREGLQGEDMQLRLKGLVALNMGALFLSVIGLMLVALGVFFA